MKKMFSFYAVCWVILFVVFNIICFATPNLLKIGNVDYLKFDGAFWVGYIFITLAFIGQIACAFVAFKAENLRKMFYNLPLITTSYTGLILTIIFGSLCMAIPNLPNWIGIIICLAILAFNAIAVIKAVAAADVVSTVDNKIKEKTAFIKTLSVEADSLVSRAKTDEAKKLAKKVYEAVRYSDPMSGIELNDIESQIQGEFTSFSNAIKNDDIDLATTSSEELLNLISDRNSKCKALK